MSDAARPLRVLVFDDVHGAAEDLRERLASIPDLALDVSCLREPAAELDLLEARRRASRRPAPAAMPTDPSAFDDIDILVVDYDLAEPENGTAGETGERVAYLVRCYSTCGYIVGLNQFNNAPVFDLTMAGNPRSFADLNISSPEVDNPALWGLDTVGYRPWWWPDLRLAPAIFRRRAELLNQDLDSDLLAMLGLDDETTNIHLTRSQFGWLTSKPTRERVSPRDVLHGRLGLRPSDDLVSPADKARVAAARVSKWVDRVLIPGQHVAVDAPHLITRYPSLAKLPDLTRMNLRTAAVAEYLTTTYIEESALPADWYSQPCWAWPKLTENTNIAENIDPFAESRDLGDFCEDVSCFLPREDSRAFMSDFEPFSRRFIAAVRDEDPLSASPHGLRGVVHEPSVAFAVAAGSV